MWLTFLAASILCLALLYIPGTLIGAALNRTMLGLAVAPCLSLLLYSLSAVIFSIANISSTPFSLIAASLGFSLAFFLFSKRMRRRIDGNPQHLDKSAIKELSLYVLLGTLVTLYVYVKCLNGADSFIQTYDNVFHINLIRCLMDSTDWSPLHTNLFPVELDNTIDPFPGTSYYPSAWHILCALAAIPTGSSAPLASNAVNFVFTGIVFPTSTLSLLKVLFPKKQPIVLLGSTVCLAFVSFPWVMLMLWPLFPNAISMMLLPSLIAAFISIFESGLTFSDRASNLCLFVLSSMSYVFIQPNSIFAAAVFLIPFCVHKIHSAPSSIIAHAPGKAIGQRKQRAILSTAFVLFAAFIWVLCFNLPFLQSTVQYYWAPLGSLSQQLYNVVTLSFAGSNPQYLLSLIVILGLVYSFVQIKYRWISLSYLFSCIVYILSASMGDTFIKHLLTGFWYTDPYRTAGIAALFAIPVASMGLYAFARLVILGLNALMPQKNPNALAYILATLTIVSVTFFPSHEVHGSSYATTPFGAIRKASLVQNDGSDSNAYDDEERAFVRHAVEIAGDESLIINMPFDGSLYAYGMDGINELYRSISGYGEEGETNESVLIRKRLASISTDTDVQKAVESLDAKYVLILEQDTERMSLFFTTFKERQWEGLLDINDNTPGFEVVLASNDMRLYKIVQ